MFVRLTQLGGSAARGYPTYLRHCQGFTYTPKLQLGSETGNSDVEVWMRFLAVVAGIAMAALPLSALPPGCNNGHPSPENPTIVLGLVGGAILMWQYARAGSEE